MVQAWLDKEKELIEQLKKENEQAEATIEAEPPGVDEVEVTACVDIKSITAGWLALLFEYCLNNTQRGCDWCGQAIASTGEEQGEFGRAIEACIQAGMEEEASMLTDLKATIKDDVKAGAAAATQIADQLQQKGRADLEEQVRSIAAKLARVSHDEDLGCLETACIATVLLICWGALGAAVACIATVPRELLLHALRLCWELSGVLQRLVCSEHQEGSEEGL